MEPPEPVNALRQLVLAAVEECTDTSLLDLVYKLMISIT